MLRCIDVGLDLFLCWLRDVLNVRAEIAKGSVAKETKLAVSAIATDVVNAPCRTCLVAAPASLTPPAKDVDDAMTTMTNTQINPTRRCRDADTGIEAGIRGRTLSRNTGAS